jgi:hypothetical protein
MRWFAWVLVSLLLVAGAGAIGVAAYDAGIAEGVARSAADAGSTVVTPYPYYGHGWGFGGFFGILGFFLFLVLVIGIVRFATGGPRRGWYGGPWGPGGSSKHGGGHGPWSDRAREVHDEWHRGGDPGATGDRPDRPGPS